MVTDGKPELAAHPAIQGLRSRMQSRLVEVQEGEDAGEENEESEVDADEVEVEVAANGHDNDGGGDEEGPEQGEQEDRREEEPPDEQQEEGRMGRLASFLASCGLCGGTGGEDA